MRVKESKQVKKEEKGKRVDGRMKKKLEEGKWMMEEEVVEKVEKWKEKGREEEKRDKKSERRKDRRRKNSKKGGGWKRTEEHSRK